LVPALNYSYLKVSVQGIIEEWRRGICWSV